MQGMDADNTVQKWVGSNFIHGYKVMDTGFNMLAVGEGCAPQGHFLPDIHASLGCDGSSGAGGNCQYRTGCCLFEMQSFPEACLCLATHFSRNITFFSSPAWEGEGWATPSTLWLHIWWSRRENCYPAGWQRGCRWASPPPWSPLQKRDYKLAWICDPG